MNNRTPVLVFLAACVLFPGVLGGQTLRFGTTPATVTGTCQLDTEVSLPQTIQVRHKGAATSYFVTFSTGSSGSFAARTAVNGGRVLQYQIYDNLTNRNVQKDLTASPAASEVISGSMPQSNGFQTQTGAFTVYLLPGQLPPAGIYTDTITMKLYPGTVGSPGAVQDTASFIVSITVNAALDIALVPRGAPFSIYGTSLALNLGVLAAGGTGSVDLVIRSNSLNSVTVSSQAGGVLKNVDTTDPSTVPYSLAVNGTPASLAAGVPWPIVTSAPATAFAGSRYTLTFTVGTAVWPTEGSYSDVLTFQATAN